MNSTLSPRLRCFGLAALALLIPVLSSAAYRVGREVAVSPPTSRVLDTSSSFHAAATFDGSQYVAFWSDVRGMRREIFGARFTVTGELLDPMAIPVGTGAVNLVSPKAVWTGSRHLVLANSDDPNEPPTAYLLGMAPDGTVLHPPRKVGLSGGSLVVLDGRVLLIRGAADGMVIEALDRDGSPLGEARQFPGRSVAVAAAAARNNALTVWIDANGLGSVRVDREGQMLDATPMRIAAGLVGQPAVASDGEDYLVVWFSSDRLLARRVSAGGVLSPVITVATGLDAYSNNPGVTWTDGHYAIVYRAGLTMKVAKLDGNDRIEVSDFAEGAVHSIAVAGTPAAAVWAAVGEDSTVIVTRQLSGGSPELVLSRGAARQRDPQLTARAGGGFDVSWVQSDRSIQRPGLFTTTFVGGAGGEVRELVAPAGGETIESGQLAGSGGATLIAWRENLRCPAQPCYRTRAQWGGSSTREIVAMPFGLPFGYGGSDPSIVRGGEQFLVSWGIPLGVTGALLDRDGNLVSTFRFEVPPPPPMSETGISLTPPRAAWDGERFLVVWSVTTTMFYPQKGEIFGAFIGKDGSASQPIAIERAIGADASVASNGAEFLVVWPSLQARSGDPVDLHVTRVNGAGGILGTRVVVEDGAPKSDPRVAWTGRDWIVTWLEAESTWGLPRALRGAQLRADDFEAFVFDILRDGAFRRRHSLAVAPGGEVAVAYGRPDATAGGVERVFVRILDRPAKMRSVRAGP